MIATSCELMSDDLMAWLALRRVNEGGVTLLEGSYYHHDRPVPHYLNAPLTALVETGQIRLAESNLHGRGMQQVMFTENGREWYEVLCGKRGVSSDSPIDAFLGTTGQGPREVIDPSAP